MIFRVGDLVQQAELHRTVKSIQYVEAPKTGDWIEFENAYWRVEEREESSRFDLVWVHGGYPPDATIRVGIPLEKLRLLNAMEALAVAASLTLTKPAPRH